MAERERGRRPQVGFPAETIARVAADYAAAQIRGEQPTREENVGDTAAVCIMHPGNNRVVILDDHTCCDRASTT